MARTAGKASWIIEPLAKKHDRAAFSCGHDSLDNYIKTQASQDARRHAAAPFVALQHDSPTVLGYYTLSSIGIDLKEIPAETAAKFARYPIVPATLLGRLAVEPFNERVELRLVHRSPAGSSAGDSDETPRN